MKRYSVNKLAQLAGVSVRTLHLYDELGLLKPALRTEARYRLYGEAELLRLQQILFYKELDFPLSEIRDILDDPDFDVAAALQQHRQAIEVRQQRLHVLLNTIDKTLHYLSHKQKIMNHEDLYEGFPQEQAAAWRAEAAEKWGEATVAQAEQSLGKLSKAAIEALKAETNAVWQQLFALHGTESPASGAVQALVAQHFALICRWWGRPDATRETYAGLGQLYLADDRYTRVKGEVQPAFARFLADAMAAFAAAEQG
jgi:DNA-binding transcriptional MerR regulator